MQISNRFIILDHLKTNYTMKPKQQNELLQATNCWFKKSDCQGSDVSCMNSLAGTQEWYIYSFIGFKAGTGITLTL